MAFSAAEMAVSGFGAESVHGILGNTPEKTMQNMGRIARDMIPLESTIIDIMDCKGDIKLI
jgi:L-cysteine desulfidase